MRIPIRIEHIRREEALRYLGWRGACEDERVLSQLLEAEDLALREAEPAVVVRRFALGESFALCGADFVPAGKQVGALLENCSEAILLAATLGMQSERLLLRTQARSASLALILDAVLTAMIEQVCDEACHKIADSLRAQGLSLTPRFSPGYGDMPLEQTGKICAVLDASRQIGLSVSSSGLMIPRKSVTAIAGITDKGLRMPSGCVLCRMASDCRMKNSGVHTCTATEE